jgi:pimeloyl-ACP methyl ester carboxylesterase
MRFVTDDGAVISYDVVGEGKPLVMTHGWDANRHFFDKNIPYLSKKYKVISYDLRGHGESDRSDRTERGLTLGRYAKDLRQLIEILGLEDVALAGWSMGTSIMLDYVRQFGCAGISKFCVIDMTPKLLCDDEWKLGLYENFYHAENLAFLGMMTNDWNDACNAFVPGMFNKSNTAKKVDIDWAFSQARDNVPHVMINMWIAMAGADYRDVLGKISVPALLLFSGDGQLYSRRHGEYMKQQIKGSKLVFFEQSGHALMIEEPDKFNEELAGFLG